MKNHGNKNYNSTRPFNSLNYQNLNSANDFLGFLSSLLYSSSCPLSIMSSCTNFLILKLPIRRSPSIAGIFFWNHDLTSVIPTFISLAEHQMERSVRHYKMIVRKAALLDTQYTDLPNDWLETIRVHLTSGDTHRLELVSLDDMVELREKSGNTAGRPRYYAHIGDTIEVYPTPDSSYDIELMYYQKILI